MRVGGVNGTVSMPGEGGPAESMPLAVENSVLCLAVEKLGKCGVWPSG